MQHSLSTFKLVLCSQAHLVGPLKTILTRLLTELAIRKSLEETNRKIIHEVLVLAPLCRVGLSVSCEF
jgi:hypothetical protein